MWASRCWPYPTPALGPQAGESPRHMPAILSMNNICGLPSPQALQMELGSWGAQVITPSHHMGRGCWQVGNPSCLEGSTSQLPGRGRMFRKRVIHPKKWT